MAWVEKIGKATSGRWKRGGMEASLVYYALRVHKILIKKGKRKPDQVLNICSSTFFVPPFLATTIWTNFILSHVFDCTVFIKLS